MKEPKTIIELNYTIDSMQEDKLKSILEILFNKDSNTISIYTAKYYSMESEFTQKIVHEVMAINAEGTIDCTDYR